ncbi:MAG: hypothetical protein GKR94_05190 [Gammaproteobacteria bacterium]|nr:hypothetical protein [Gammaproteobacteria bacterium]
MERSDAAGMAPAVELKVRAASTWAGTIALLYLLALPGPPLLYNGSVLCIAAAGLALVAAYRRGLLSHPAVRDVLAVFACFWIPMVLASLDAHDANRSAGSSALYLRFALMGVFVAWALTSALSRARLAVVLFCALWIVDALVQALAGSNMFGFPYTGGQLMGLFYPKLQLGVVLSVFTPLVLDYLAQRARTHRAWWLALVPMAVVIALTLHRNSWLMFALACGLYATYWMVERRWRPRLGDSLVTVVVVAGLCGMLAQHDYLAQRVGTSVAAVFGAPQTLDAQLGQRPDIWRTAAAMAAANWMNGIGPRGFRSAYGDYAEPDDYWLSHEPPKVPAHPHQLMLEVASETGAIGVIGYVLALGLLWRRYRVLDPSARARAAPWLMCIVIAIFPLNIHKAFYGFFMASLVWWVLAAGIAALHVHDVGKTGDGC